MSEEESARRVYYQNIVYDICNILDRYQGGKSKSLVCGTVNNPTTEVQDAVRKLCDRLMEQAAIIMQPHYDDMCELRNAVIDAAKAFRPYVGRACAAGDDAMMEYGNRILELCDAIDSLEAAEKEKGDE